MTPEQNANMLIRIYGELAYTMMQEYLAPNLQAFIDQQQFIQELRDQRHPLQLVIQGITATPPASDGKEHAPRYVVSVSLVWLDHKTGLYHPPMGVAAEPTAELRRAEVYYESVFSYSTENIADLLHSNSAASDARPLFDNNSCVTHLKINSCNCLTQMLVHAHFLRDDVLEKVREVSGLKDMEKGNLVRDLGGSHTRHDPRETEQIILPGEKKIVLPH